MLSDNKRPTLNDKLAEQEKDLPAGETKQVEEAVAEDQGSEN